jgi:hypothetical protein
LKNLKNEKIKVLVPEIVIEEWNKNKDHAVKQGALKHFKDITEAFDRILKLLGDKGERDVLSFLLDEKDNKDYFKDFIEKFKLKRKEVEDAITENIEAIDNLFKSKKIEVIKATTEVILQSANYAIDKKAPFLKKNSFADAIIFFSFLDYVSAKKIENAMFITYNVDDFCEKKDSKRKLHPDLVEEFGKSGSKFFHIVGEALNTVQKDIVSQQELELIREFQDEGESDSDYCRNCNENIDRYSPIYFNSVDLVDENTTRIARQQSQEELPFANDFIKQGKALESITFDSLRVATCDYCNTEHFICAKCGTVNEILEQEYGKKKECNGCSLFYLIVNEYDKKGMIENTTYAIVKNLKSCRMCGNEFDDDDYWSDEICEECENKFSRD